MDVPRFSPAIRRLNEGHPKRDQALTEIENSLARLAKTYSLEWQQEAILNTAGLTEKSEGSFNSIKTLVRLINYSLHSLGLLTALKTVDLTDGLVRAANEHRFLFCAFASRSLVELAAALFSAKKELDPHLEPRKLTSEEGKKLTEITVRYAYGGRYDFPAEWSDPKRSLEERLKRPSEEHLPRFTGMVQNLAAFAVEEGFAQSIDGVMNRYAKLCDFVHPTWASAILYGSGQLGRFRLRHADQEKLAYLLDLTVLPACSFLGIIEELLRRLAAIQFSGSANITDAQS